MKKLIGILTMASGLICQLELRAATSIAAQHPNDEGIEKDPRVLFAENFESGNLSKWDERVGAFAVVADKPHTGKFCVQSEMELGKNHGGDAKKWFMPGKDKVHARFYAKFAKDYIYNHHFVTLLANQKNNKWSAFGKAGTRPDGGNYFSSGMEPAFAWGKNPSPGEINLYAYYMDMEIDPKMNLYWGNGFFPPGPGKGKSAGPNRVLPKLGDWECWEFMIEANTPGKADGKQMMWLNGKLAGEFTGIRWRDNLDLKINCLWLMHYGFDSGDPTRGFWKVKEGKPLRQSVWFDDVVVATEYIGPITTK